MPREITDIKAFLEISRRKDATGTCDELKPANETDENQLRG